MKKEQIQAVCCGASHVLMLSQRGRLFQFNTQQSSIIPRQEYVTLYADHIFSVSVRKAFGASAKGFLTGCPNGSWTTFHPEQLMNVLNGTASYEWDELEKNAQYEGYKPADNNIHNFWSVFSELTEEGRRNFLGEFVVTGWVYRRAGVRLAVGRLGVGAFSSSDGRERLPVGGLAKLRLTIAKVRTEVPDEYNPTAHTCYPVLHLPNLSSIAVRRHKVLHAITFYEEVGSR